MLKSVRTPDGAIIRFEYDALGRRTLKETHDTCYRYAWDGNVLLHEWSYDRREKPRTQQDELGRIRYDRQEPYTNLITWVYDGGSYTPVAKLTEEDSYSIVQDYLGTPIQALDSKGEVVWDCILDIYGDVLELRGKRDFIPFRFQGQYEDQETGLYYNRFRYYSPETGNYISQDPIRLAGGNPTLYGYVEDTNNQIDVFGLDCTKNKKTAYSGNSRRDAFRQAKRDAGIPMGQQPKKVYYTDLMDGHGKPVMGKNNNPIQTRNYEFADNNSETITFQEHSLGHIKSNPGDPASKPHFNIRDSNLGTGHVDGTHGHYNF